VWRTLDKFRCGTTYQLRTTAFFFFLSLLLLAGSASRARGSFATVGHSDILGSKRTIVIRRELPRTISAGSVRRPTA
jgi:hypothetical protein